MARLSSMSRSNVASGANARKFHWSLTFVSLRFRDFRLVWMGSVTEHIGEFMEIAATLWLVNQLTHSPLVLTIVGTARFVPMIIFPIIGGVIADRVNRRSLLMISLVVCGLLSLCLAILTLTGLIQVWHLIVFGLLSGVAMSFNHPARQAILPNLIQKEHLLNAVSLDFLSVQGARLVGMALVGYLMTVFGLWPIFALRALGCLLAMFWLRMARVPITPVSVKEQTTAQNLMEGLRYLRSNIVVLGLVVLYLIPWLAGNTFSTFLPVFASEILGLSAVGYGYLQASPGMGALISLVGLTLLTHYRRKTQLLVVSGILMALGLVAFSASSWAVVSISLLVFVGAMQMVFMAVNTAIIQGIVPDKLRGRVMSWREVPFGLGPTGSILFGAIAQTTGVRLSLGILGIIILIPVLSIAFLPRIREIDGRGGSRTDS